MAVVDADAVLDVGCVELDGVEAAVDALTLTVGELSTGDWTLDVAVVGASLIAEVPD